MIWAFPLQHKKAVSLHYTAFQRRNGRAITTHSFGLHICNKPKGVQTRRSIPNASEIGG